MSENMQNEVPAIDKDKIKERKKKRHRKKNVILTVIIAVLVISCACTLYINMDNPILRSAFSGIGIDVLNGASVIEFEKTENYALSEFNGNAIVSRSNAVACVDSDMNELWRVEQSAVSPVIKSEGKYTLTYSFDAPGAVVAKNGKPTELSTDNNFVIGGSVNKNGYTVLIVREKGYKAQLVVYSPEAEVIYKWHSADNYILDAAVSYDNRTLAVATADFSKNMASGGLLFFNFSQEKPYAGQVLENNIIMELKYTGKNSLLAVGDISAAVFDSQGEKKAEYNYGGKKLTNYDIGTDNSLILALHESDSVLSDTEVKLLSKELKEKGTYIANSDVTSIDSVDGDVLLACDRKLVLLSSRGNELKKLDVNKDIKSAILFGNGDDVLIASGGSAEVVNLK